MKKITVGELSAGTKYSKPVFVDDEHLFVPEGVVIRQKDIDRLGKWGVDTVLTDGEVVTELSSLQARAETIGNILDQKGNPEQLAVYRQTVAQMERIFESVRMNSSVGKKEIDPTVDKIIDSTLKHVDEMVALVLRNDKTTPSLGKSAVDSCILAIVVGTSLSLDRQKIRTLSFGAALHDIGMV